MEEGLFELLGDIILNIAVILPSAFIRWLLLGRHRKFNYYLEHNAFEVNTFVGIFSSILIAAAVYQTF